MNKDYEAIYKGLKDKIIEYDRLYAQKGFIIESYRKVIKDVTATFLETAEKLESEL